MHDSNIKFALTHLEGHFYNEDSCTIEREGANSSF